MKIIQYTGYQNSGYTSFEIPTQDGGVFAIEWDEDFNLFDTGIYKVDVKEPSLIKEATLEQLHLILKVLFKSRRITFWNHKTQKER